MSLARKDVEDFLSTEKLVRASAQNDRMPGMAWRRESADRVLWRAPVERGGDARGNSIVLTVTVALARDWSYTLRYRDEDVWRWDFTEPPVNHSNSARLCPRSEFAAKVRALEHEHRYVPGGDLKCAVPLNGMSALTHEQVLRAFCQRTRIVFQQGYRGPPVGEQLGMV